MSAGIEIQPVAKIHMTDWILKYTILPFIPHTVSPNSVTVLRFILTPFVILTLYFDYLLVGLILFGVTAFTDAIDGAMARTRNQITEWGKTFDPLADKLLVGSAVVILAGRYVGTGITIAIIVIELLLIGNAVYMKEFKGKPIQALWAGKLKMVLQCLAVCAILIFAFSGATVWFFIAQGAFYLAIFFGLISLFVYRSV